MAEVVEVQLDDVQDFTFDGDEYRGITSVQVTVNQGRLRPVRKEGEMIGAQVEREADDQRFAVEFQAQSNSAATEAELAQQSGQGDLTFTARERGSGGTRKTYKIENALIGQGSGRVGVNFQEGQHGVQGVGTSFAEDAA